MQKVLLVLEMPIDCISCPLCHKGELVYRGDFLYKQTYMCTARPEEIEEFYLEDVFGDKPNWCPLQPAPEKKASMMYLDDETYYFRRGWNACVESLEPNKNKV